MLRMPKSKKVEKRQEAEAATAETADDFDVMLAELRAADLAAPPSSSSSSTASNGPRARATINSSAPRVSEETMMMACKAGELSKLRRWGRQGVRTSALSFCSVVVMGRVDVMRCLVEELGADVNLAHDDYPNGTPLFMAVNVGRLDMFRCLVELGADVNHVMHDGSTLLHMAAQQGHLDVVQCLIAKFGADVNKAKNDGATPLYCAVEGGHLGVVRCLVEENGADLNQAMHNGQTPLMAAAKLDAENKNDKMVRCLIKHGANSQASTTDGFSNAAYFSKYYGAPVVQTEYLEAKAHCSNPSCSGAGLKKCTGCKQVRYCGQECQLAHWKAHKKNCKSNYSSPSKARRTHCNWCDVAVLLMLLAVPILVLAVATSYFW